MNELFHLIAITAKICLPKNSNKFDEISHHICLWNNQQNILITGPLKSNLRALMLSICPASGRSSSCNSRKNNSFIVQNNGQVRIFHAYFANLSVWYTSSIKDIKRNPSETFATKIVLKSNKDRSSDLNFLLKKCGAHRLQRSHSIQFMSCPIQNIKSYISGFIISDQLHFDEQCILLSSVLPFSPLLPRWQTKVNW